MALPKWTNEHPQALCIRQRTITIPPNTAVMPSLLTAQTHPDNWRNPLLWQPSRWVSSTSPPTSAVGHETLIKPAQSTFFPWSDGPQNCPGEKFAQVEFVAVLAQLLNKHRLEVVKMPGESFDSAKSRVLAATEDCDVELLLRMRDADQVQLNCVDIKT